MKLLRFLPAALAATLLPTTLLAQGNLPLQGTLNVSFAPVDYVIPATSAYGSVWVRVRAGDGGAAIKSNDGCIAYGGRGVAIDATFPIGTGPGELQPGGTLRFIIGDHGAHRVFSDTGAWGASGGGGSALLYLPPGGTWADANYMPIDGQILLAAGAGGGGYYGLFSLWCTDGYDGTDGQFGTAGTDGPGDEGGNGGDNGQAGQCADPFIGGPWSTGGGSAFQSTANNNCGTFPVGGFPDGAPSPTGGWGFGNGGRGGEGGGGGGGYSGGGGGDFERNGGGGGSYVHPSAQSVRMNYEPPLDQYADPGVAYFFVRPAGASCTEPIAITDTGQTTETFVEALNTTNAWDNGEQVPNCSGHSVRRLWLSYTNPTADYRRLEFSPEANDTTPFTVGTNLVGDDSCDLINESCGTASPGSPFSVVVPPGETRMFRMATANTAWGSFTVQVDLSWDTTSDPDGDGIPNSQDKCPNSFDPTNADQDGDGIGDPCDPDRDGDGVSNLQDNCPVTANANQSDIDYDGIGDVCDSFYDPNCTDDDPFEPNDNCLEPTLVSVGSYPNLTVAATDTPLTQDDVDVFETTVPAGVRLTVDVLFDPSESGLAMDITDAECLGTYLTVGSSTQTGYTASWENTGTSAQAVQVQVYGLLSGSTPCANYELVLTHTSSPKTYCDANPNSTGVAAKIGHFGTTSLAANDLVLTAVDCVPNQFGVFFYGPTDTNGSVFGEGKLCIWGSDVGLVRLRPAQQVNASGEVAYFCDYTSGPMSGGMSQIIPGVEWHFQFWYRDPSGGPNGFNLTDGLSVLFVP